MKTKLEFPEVHKDFMRERGIPAALRHDNAKSEQSTAIKELHRDHIIADVFTELHHPQQNPAELKVVKHLKNQAQVLMDRIPHCHDNLWFGAQKCIADIHNVTADPSKN